SSSLVWSWAAASGSSSSPSAWPPRAGSGMMAEFLIWLIAALCAVGSLVLGRAWGRVEGKRAGKREAERDAMEDKNERVERGRDAVRDGRGAGDPAERLRRNDGRW